MLAPPFGGVVGGFGISFGGVVVPPVTGGVAGTTVEVPPHGSQAGAQQPWDFLLLQRPFSLSSRLGLAAAQGSHGAGAGAGAQQSWDFLLNRAFSLSNRPTLVLPQSHGAGAPQLLHPAPETTTGAGAAGWATGSAPASAAEVMSRNAAVTMGILRKS